MLLLPNKKSSNVFDDFDIFPDDVFGGMVETAGISFSSDEDSFMMSYIVLMSEVLNVKEFNIK